MAQVEILLPKMGESVSEATIVEWLKEEGDHIEADEFIVNIATDKVDNEVPSEYEGTLVKKLFTDGDVVQVGQAFAIIETEAAVSTAPVSASPISSGIESAVTTPVSEVKVEKEVLVADDYHAPKVDSNGRFYSPLVRSIAKEENIAIEELARIEGSGKEGRVTKKDIIYYVENRVARTISAPVSDNGKEKVSVKTAEKAPVLTQAGDEIIEMDRMRKLISEHMVMSKHTSPHVTSFVEADVTNIVLWRNKVKDEFLRREGEKITYTPLFIEAIVKAIKDYPLINITVDGDRIIKKKNINIGMAAALPSGNLIVPVIKNADQLSLVGLTKKVNDLANKARTNKLNPDDISGGTYTLTNVGTFGNISGTPIINQPQVAIMAVGAIIKKPVVLETPQGDVIAIRHMMILSHAYDHRVVDGALGGMFVRRVADYLEKFDINRAF
jgi:2-oxoglutarate dehydrogenase E2 component (dihydrolipoamide succinyltransferase)